MKKEKFKRKAEMSGGNNHDYSNVKYVSRDTKIVIGCPIKGDIIVSAFEHLRGR